MKPATFFLALSLILLFTKHSSLASKAIMDDILVYDSEGNQLQKHSSYFISPPIWGPLGDKLILASPNGENETCTEADILQPGFLLDPASATRFTFTSVDLNDDAIKIGYPVVIQSTESPCEGSTVWKVASRTGVPVNIITTGGIINTPNSCLRITKPRDPLFLNTYIFEHCPNLCGAGPKICRPIGTANMGHLSPNGERSFEFILLKASESSVTI